MTKDDLLWPFLIQFFRVEMYWIVTNEREAVTLKVEFGDSLNSDNLLKNRTHISCECAYLLRGKSTNAKSVFTLPGCDDPLYES